MTPRDRPPRPTFAGRTAGFDTIVRARVAEYFDTRGLSRHADGPAIFKSAFWILATIALYVGVVWGALPGVLVVPLGFSIAAVGFNVGHDALHRATSRHAWVNMVLGWSFDVLGGSSYAWRLSHNVVHHTYTNMPGHDHDLEPGPWLRFHPGGRASRFHRGQHVFAFGFYTLTMLAWTFVGDFVQLAEARPRTSARAWAGMSLGKVVHFALFLGVPLFVYPGAAWHVLLGYVLMQMATGFTLAVVFQLAHVVEGPSFPVAGEDGRIACSWGEHQLHTTSNFSDQSAFVTFVTGGLNHQIEHHLFPTISHTHYPALAAIVRRTAHEHDLPYHETPTFMLALASHIRVLRAFGRTV